MKAKIKTLGCRANQYDSMKMSQQLREYGCEIVALEDDADIIVVNSCTVTNLAERKSSQEVRKAVRKKNNKKIIIVAGCSTRTHDKKISNISGIDFVIEDYNLNEILKKININKKISQKSADENPRIRSYIKIEEGCNDNCSYCIVPKVRGRVQSMPIDQIIKEAESLLLKGAKEIVLTGINMCCYNYEGYSLQDVIKKLCQIKNLERLRLSSLEPQYISDQLLETIGDEKKVCSYFHIPIQSGSNYILSLMNRKYKREDIKNVIKKIRQYKENSFISADIIVGFPGEKAEDFDKTKSLVKELNLSKLHIFRYSKRPGTIAAEFKNQIQESEKKLRAKKTNEISKELFLEYAKEYLGKIVYVLIEEMKNGDYFGLTENYLKVKIKNNMKISFGDLVRVQLTEQKNNYFDSLII